MVLSVWAVGWFAQAQNIKSQIASQMAAMNPALGSMKARDIEVSGFPLRMIVTIHDPALILNLKPFLSQLHKRIMAARGNSAGVLTAPSYPEGTLNHTFRGTVTLTLNALSDRMELVASGASMGELIQSTERTTFNTTYTGQTSCSARLSRNIASFSNHLWDMGQFMASDNWLADLRGLSCFFPASVTTDGSNQTILTTTGTSTITATTTPVDAQYHSEFNLHFKDVEVLPAGDALMNRLRQAFTPVSTTYVPLPMSLYGKQSLTLHTISQTTEPFVINRKGPFRFEIKTLAFTNQASTINGSAIFSSQPQGNQEQGEFSINLTSAFSEAQGGLAKIGVQQFVGEVMRNNEFVAQHPALTVTALEASVYDALPDISALGTLTQRIRGTFSGDRSKNEGTFTISDLEFSTQDYGIRATAAGTRGNGQLLPAVNANITCRNCLNMVEAIGAYLMRVEAAAIVFAPQNAGMIAMQPAEIQGIKGLLAALGVPASTAPADLQFTIRNDAGGMNINGKQLAELLALVQLYLKPAAAPAAPVTVP